MKQLAKIILSLKFLLLFTFFFFTSCKEEWEQHKIDSKYALELINRYKERNPLIDNSPNFFSRDDINFVADGSTGARYYFGKEGDKYYLIMVGTQEPSDGSNSYDDDETKIIVSPEYNGETRIDLDKASELTLNYQSGFSPTQQKGGFFLVGIFDYLKDVPDYSGISFNYGMEQDGTINMVGFATKLESTNNTHIVLQGQGARSIDKSLPCPSDCGKANTINHN